MSLTVNSIRKEFGESTTKEQQDVAAAYELSTRKAQNVISKIESTGNRQFRSSEELDNLRRTNVGTKSDQVLLGFQEFSSALYTTGLLPYEAAFGGELAARQMASNIELNRFLALESLDSARPSVINNITNAQKRAQSIMSRDVNGMRDNFIGIQNSSAALDPLNQTSQYIFYDAFAILRGPQQVKIIDFNNDISSANITITTDISPGSFSITFANDMEQYVDDYGVYAFKTGDTVRIYATRRFDDDSDRYAHIFWGVIERVADHYSDGQATITVSGQDITVWLQYTTVRPNPTLIEIQMNPGLQAQKYGHKYAGKSVLEVMADVLFNDIGDFNAMTGYSLQDASERGNTQEIIKELSTASTNEEKVAAAAKLQRKSDEQSGKQGIIDWWKDLFLDELVLKVLGYDGIVNVVSTTNSDKFEKGVLLESEHETPDGRKEKIRSIALDTNSQCNVLEILDKYVPIRTFYGTAMAGTFELEDTPKIEVIRAAVEATMFEFFMDRDGALVFKPPFYNEYPANNNTDRYEKIRNTEDCSGGAGFGGGPEERFHKESAYQYILNEEDILSFDIAEDATAIVTRQEVTGEPRDAEMAQEILWGGYQNNDLLRRYGLRVGSPKKQRMIDNMSDLNVFAKALMDYQNTKFYTATVTIVGRPELHLGRTVYLTSRNTIFYIIAITHNFTAGGSLTTTLTLVAGRRMFLDAEGSPQPDVFDGEQFIESDLEQLKKKNSDPDKVRALALKGEDKAAAEESQAREKRQQQIDDLERKKALFNKIRKEKKISAQDQKAFGFMPRRISDSNGRRIYGTLPYGIAVSPPIPPEEKDKQTEPGTVASKGSNPSGESRPGGSTAPASANNASGANAATAAGILTVGSDPDTRQRQQDTRGGGAPARTNQTGQPTVVETTKNCAEQKDKKSFNPSSLVAQRRVTGINL